MAKLSVHVPDALYDSFMKRVQKEEGMRGKGGEIIRHLMEAYVSQ